MSFLTASNPARFYRQSDKFPRVVGNSMYDMPQHGSLTSKVAYISILVLLNYMPRLYYVIFGHKFRRLTFLYATPNFLSGL